MKKIISILCTVLCISIGMQAQTQKQVPIQTQKQIKPMNYTILVLYRATNLWLSLSREQRETFYETKVIPIIQKFTGKLTVRLFDSEAFHAKTSDFMLIECANLKDYYFFMEYMRDTELFGKPYIEINDVIIGIEGGFEEFEETEYKPSKNK